ncbi:MAG: RnfABCDGE type electron transport complex subunit D [Clostridia bacterium]
MNKLVVASSPHIQSKINTNNIMTDVIIALFPAVIASIIYFGISAMYIIVICVLSCVLSEYVSRIVMKREQTVGDFSAVVTGLLLAMNLPASINPLIAAFGGVIAIVVVKQMFGGIGQNFVNPALASRIILMNSFPSQMTNWTTPFDAVSTATPLGILAEGTGEALPSYMDLFMGNRAGCLGETCIAALLVGGAYLVYKNIISPVIPLTYLGTVFAFSLVLGRDPIFEILSGGLMLGAIFMATDYTTSPIHTKARVVFAIGCGLLTVLIRVYGSLPEGVSYSIVIMNILVPLIERVVKITPFGAKKAESE